MSGRGGLEESLQVAVGPLVQGAFVSQGAASIERFAQIDDDSFPLLVGELSIEVDAQSDSDRETEEAAQRRSPAPFNGACGLRGKL